MRTGRREFRFPMFCAVVEVFSKARELELAPTACRQSFLTGVTPLGFSVGPKRFFYTDTTPLGLKNRESEFPSYPYALPTILLSPL